MDLKEESLDIPRPRIGERPELEQVTIVHRKNLPVEEENLDQIGQAPRRRTGQLTSPSGCSRVWCLDAGEDR